MLGERFSEGSGQGIEKALGAEVIAIQQSEKEWDNRTHLIEVAKAIQKQGIKLLRLEFPRTEIQLFGDSAILYYTYIFETAFMENRPSMPDAEPKYSLGEMAIGSMSDGIWTTVLFI
jgi:hypothetical protein